MRRNPAPHSLHITSLFLMSGLSRFAADISRQHGFSCVSLRSNQSGSAVPVPLEFSGQFRSRFRSSHEPSRPRRARRIRIGKGEFSCPCENQGSSERHAERCRSPCISARPASRSDSDLMARPWGIAVPQEDVRCQPGELRSRSGSRGSTCASHGCPAHSAQAQDGDQ
jgi:hypothetical protein